MDGAAPDRLGLDELDEIDPRLLVEFLGACACLARVMSRSEDILSKCALLSFICFRSL